MVGPAVVIDAVTARAFLSLLADGRRRAVREQWRLAEEVVAGLAALDALDAQHRPAPAPPGTPPDVASGDWVPTVDAAAILALSERQVRRMAARGLLRSKHVAGRLLLDAADVLAEADARTEAAGTPGDDSGRPRIAA
jgi:hypothetical protein